MQRPDNIFDTLSAAWETSSDLHGRKLLQQQQASLAKYSALEQPLTTSPAVTPVQIGATSEVFLAFTSTSAYTVTFTRPITAQLFMIGGGGAGGYVITGGGGSGAYYYNTSFTFRNGTYTFKVGAGGASGTSSSLGGNGEDTYISFDGSDVLVNGSSLRCRGGGRGGVGRDGSGDLSSTVWNGAMGGCGGGGTGFYSSTSDRDASGGLASNAGTVGIGYAGGAGRQRRSDNCLASGGGGGIGGPGESFNNVSPPMGLGNTDASVV